MRVVVKKRGMLLSAAVFAITALLLFFETHFFLLDDRSGRITDKIIGALRRDGDEVPLTALFATDHAAKPPAVCILPPYSELGSLPELKGASVGLDAEWLDLVGESWIGIVVVDGHGRALTVARLPRSRIDVVPYTQPARCYNASAHLVRRGVTGEGIVQATVLGER